jgi:sarcosine oxidase subunit beta
LAYAAALMDRRVDVREHCRFTGLRLDSHGAVAAVRTSDGELATTAVLLTGGPDLAAVGRAAGGQVAAGGTRHQVVVTAAVPGVDVRTLPMVFDVASGIYWRPGENGGLLWGMSNPDEPPGPAVDFDWDYFARMRDRVAMLFPATRGLTLRRAWAATIDYTSDHLPILGPLLHGGDPVPGTVVASAGGHGMMWGPGVARAAADLVLSGETDVLDVSELGLDRFDGDGRSRLAADPIALPFPQGP